MVCPIDPVYSLRIRAFHDGLEKGHCLILCEKLYLFAHIYFRPNTSHPHTRGLAMTTYLDLLVKHRRNSAALVFRTHNKARHKGIYNYIWILSGFSGSFSICVCMLNAMISNF